MSDDEVSEELNVDWVLGIHLSFKIRDQFLEHFLQDSQLKVIVHCQNFNRDSLVDWKDLLNCWAVVSHQCSSSFLELPLLKVSFGELHKVSVQNIWTLFFSETKAFVPLTSL